MSVGEERAAEGKRCGLFAKSSPGMLFWTSRDETQSCGPFVQMMLQEAGARAQRTIPRHSAEVVSEHAQLCRDFLGCVSSWCLQSPISVDNNMSLGERRKQGCQLTLWILRWLFWVCQHVAVVNTHFFSQMNVNGWENSHLTLFLFFSTDTPRILPMHLTFNSSMGTRYFFSRLPCSTLDFVTSHKVSYVSVLFRYQVTRATCKSWPGVEV